jgi:uncharacterized protein (TIGR00725 family)
VLCCAAYREGDTIAVLPGEDPAAASPHADIVICTGLGSYRNGIVGRSNAVIAVGGGAGTLQVRCHAGVCGRGVGCQLTAISMVCSTCHQAEGSWDVCGGGAKELTGLAEGC